MRCSVQPRYRIFVKGYGFLVFAKNMGKSIGEIISKNLRGKNTAKNFLIMINNLQQMHLKVLRKEQFNKQQKQLVIRLVIKPLMNMTKK